MPEKFSYWIVSGKYSMMQKFSVILFGLFTFMLLARLFSPEKFGVWALFIIISSIVEMLRYAIIKNGYVLFINTRGQEAHPGIEYAALLTNCIFSIVLILFFFLTGKTLENIFHAKSLSSILNYYSLTLLFLIPFTQREFFLLARMDFKGIFFMYFFRNGIFMGIAAYFFLTQQDVSLGTLAFFYGISTLVGVIIGFAIGQKYEKLHMRWNKKIFFSFINYGKYVLGTNFFALIFKNTDNFATARFISPTALAFYNTSARIKNFGEMPSQVLGDVMFPRATQIFNTGNMAEIKRIYENTVAATLSFTLPFFVAVSLFPKEIIFLLAGQKYLDATQILQVMIFYVLFLPFIQQFGNIMDATGRQRYNFLVTMFFAIFNILSNVFFIKKFGILGGAYGTLFSYVFLFLTTQVILTRLLQISQFSIIRNIFVFYSFYLKLIKGSFTKFVNVLVKNKPPL